MTFTYNPKKDFLENLNNNLALSNSLFEINVIKVDAPSHFEFVAQELAK